MRYLLLAIPVLFLFGCQNPFVMRGGGLTPEDIAENRKRKRAEQEQAVIDNDRLIRSQQLQLQRNQQMLQGQSQQLSQQQTPTIVSDQGDVQRLNEELSQVKNQIQQMNDNQPMTWRCKNCNATEISGKRGDYIASTPEVNYVCNRSPNLVKMHIWKRISE